MIAVTVLLQASTLLASTALGVELRLVALSRVGISRSPWSERLRVTLKCQSNGMASLLLMYNVVLTIGTIASSAIDAHTEALTVKLQAL